MSNKRYFALAPGRGVFFDSSSGLLIRASKPGVLDSNKVTLKVSKAVTHGYIKEISVEEFTKINEAVAELTTKTSTKKEKAVEQSLNKLLKDYDNQSFIRGFEAFAKNNEEKLRKISEQYAPREELEDSTEAEEETEDSGLGDKDPQGEVSYSIDDNIYTDTELSELDQSDLSELAESLGASKTLLKKLSTTDKLLAFIKETAPKT